MPLQLVLSAGLMGQDTKGRATFWDGPLALRPCLLVRIEIITRWRLKSLFASVFLIIFLGRAKGQ